jgi:hypothetical protein
MRTSLSLPKDILSPPHKYINVLRSFALCVLRLYLYYHIMQHCIFAHVPESISKSG